MGDTHDNSRVFRAKNKKISLFKKIFRTFVCINQINIFSLPQNEINPCLSTFIICIMNKNELIAAIAEKAGLSKVDAKKALDAFVCTVEETLAKGDKLTLVGFGTFSVAKKAARTGINPATKKAIKIPAKKVAKFKVGAELAAKVK